MKKSRLLLAIGIIAVAATACQSELEKKVNELNDMCPLLVDENGQFGELTSVTYDDGDVTLVYTMEENIVNVHALAMLKPLLERAALAACQNPKGELRDIINLLIEEEAGLVMTVTGATTGESVSVRLSSDQIKGAAGNDDGDQLALLKAQVEVTRAQLPAQLDEGVLLRSVELEDDYVVYEVIIIDSEYFSHIVNNQDEVRQDMLTGLTTSGEQTAKFVGLCRSCGKGISYSYVDANSGERCRIDTSSDELGAALAD